MESKEIEAFGGWGEKDVKWVCADGGHIMYSSHRIILYICKDF